MLGAREAGNQTEKINLQDRKINFCLGCMDCQSNGGVCVQNDDMAEILDKMV
jgi:multimeric flavodoxin WrbA